MLTKVTISIILVIVGINCEESKSETFQKNWATFEADGERLLVNGAYIPVLQQASITSRQVNRLWLMYNNLSTIEPGAFEDLPNLDDLYIIFNNLQKIEVGVFNDLKIVTLNVSNNALEYIAPHAFDNMTRLTTIDISDNKLKNWNSQWFAKTPSVEFFWLDNNLFTEIPAEAFGERKRTGNYYNIYFNGNPINQIDDDAFKNFQIVKKLEISINSTDVLDGNFLRATHFVEVNIKCLDEKYVSTTFIADSTKLTGNAFDRNCTDKINAWSAEHQKNPKTFQKNGVTFEVEGSKFVLDGAYTPVLRRGSVTDIVKVERLWLSRSNISTIEPGAFGYLPNLRDLIINYNNIQRIEVGVFNGLNVTSLSVSSNEIEYIASHAFDNMTRLWSIDISFNKLKIWDNQWFSDTPSVDSFSLGYNLFTEIPAYAFGEKRRTENFYIDFSGNPINQIDDDAFKNFAVVSHLYIGINCTDALDGNFLRATHFDRVDIRIDNIECLDEKYFSKIFVADSTKLSSHGLNRDCKNKMKAWAADHEKTVIVEFW